MKKIIFFICTFSYLGVFSQKASKDTNLVSLTLTLLDTSSAKVKFQNDTSQKRINISFKAGIEKKLIKTTFYVTKSVALGVFENMFNVTIGDNGTATFKRINQNPSINCNSLNTDKKTGMVKLIVTTNSTKVASVSADLNNIAIKSKVSLSVSAKASVTNSTKTQYVNKAIACLILQGRMILEIKEASTQIIPASDYVAPTN